MAIWLTLLAIHLVFSAICIVRVLLLGGEPSYMALWLLVVLFIPLIGPLFYAISGSYRITRRRRLRRIVRKTRYDVGRAEGADVPDEWRVVARVADELQGSPPLTGNAIELYTDQDSSYDAIADAVCNAQHHVHMEYFGFHADPHGKRIRDCLIERARAGVECRLLLDGMGCLTLPREFTQPLLDAGIELDYFLPVSKIFRRWSWHLRMHRKLVVIDGTVAFVGSQNIGDESRGRKHLQPWLDTHARVCGPIVPYLQQIFLEDWVFVRNADIDPAPYLTDAKPCGDHVTQILPTGPDQPFRTLEAVLSAAFAAAQKRIDIATPYFVPSATIRIALIAASHRGVKVRVVVPLNCDIGIAKWAGRSYYEELLAAGVNICEMNCGMLHSKVVAIDDAWSMIGSANMDMRSFQVNFELSMLTYSPSFAKQMRQTVDSYCKDAISWDSEVFTQRPFPDRLKEGVCRLFAPLI